MEYYYVYWINLAEDSDSWGGGGGSCEQCNEPADGVSYLAERQSGYQKRLCSTN
jgi:hypothetical protein